MGDHKNKTLHYLYFLCPSLLILVMFTLGTYMIIENRIEQQYKSFEYSSINLASSYKTNIENSSEAYRIIKKILSQKMKAAAESVLFYDGITDKENLEMLGDKLQLDTIYLYNPDGVIVSSMDGNYLGWSPPPDHPVERYMNNGEYYLEEGIRADTESGLYYKYVYIRRPDGYFYQLGVSAEHINGFMVQFESQALLDKIYKEHRPYFVILLGQDETVIGSNDQSRIGKTFKELAVSEGFSSIYKTGRTMVKEVPIFLTVTPISEKGEEGLLMLAWDLRTMDLEVEKIIFQGILIFLVIITVVTCILYYAFNKRKKLYEVAYYEERTGLPNEQYYRVHVTKELANHKLRGKDFILIHLENMAKLNHTYGYEYGELLLKEVSERMKELMEEKTEIYFLEGEYFGIIIDADKSKDHGSVLRKLQELFSQALLTDKESDRLQVRFGVVPDIDKFRSSSALLKAATIAASNNSLPDVNDIPYFDEKMEEHAERERSILRNLRKLVENKNSDQDSLYLHYQPKISLDKEEIIGFEALARFKIPTYGVIPPMEFIEIAERNNLIYDIGLLILRNACAFIKEMEEAGLKGLSIAINISLLQLLRKEFTSHVDQILKEYEIDPETLEFEITESILSDNFDLINLKLRQIRKRGIKVSMDDFGTGFSSLARLREISIDAVKLDRHFTNRIKDTERASYISIDIISMAHRVGLKVVAEGVETEEQLEFLKKHQCDYAQGYYISMPMDKEKAKELIQQEKTAMDLESCLHNT